MDKKAHVRLQVVEEAKPGKRISLGMFPELADTPEEAFKEAEWDDRLIEGF